MQTALVIRFLAFEDLGSLQQILDGRECKIETLDANLDSFAGLDPSAHDLVIVLGGPIGAFDEAKYPFLKPVLSFVEQRLQCGKKILGVCLGAQLIARALGSNVCPMGRKEIGFAPISLTDEGLQSCLEPLSSGVPVLHWHGDQFEIPAGATRLAATDICPNQAFSVGNSVLALQFHLEANPQRIEHWLVGHAGELDSIKLDPRVIRDQAQACADELLAAAQTVFASWLDRN
ncbi:glutamine amidotransferase [Stutzerimonas kunmingensis]|uniref:glutamine amidotransferase n=1 Tax=Stutzerimonas kunmingensis TaxID=1211807 RepID=UPI0028AD2184|nr:glutamine amidotransferase [Stutzerimonas kunmingensis]